MTVNEVADYLYSIPKFTKKNGLDHTRTLLNILGDPAMDRKVIHVAGSNGKGSTCAFLNSVLMSADRSAGMFTSPHLTDIRERIRVNGQLCGSEDFLYAFEKVYKAAEELTKGGFSYPSFFEFVFAMAMVVFERNDAEYIILEAGMGGLLDDTNVIEKPVMTVITSVSLEHTQYLGETIEEIAAHKAGIIKQGVPLVYYAGDEAATKIIREKAQEKGIKSCALTDKSCADIRFKDNFIDFSLNTSYDNTAGWMISSPALYQTMNAALAITAIRMMNEDNSSEAFSDEDIRFGIENAHIDGRMQRVGEGIYFDGAHNPDGLRKFVRSARAMTKGDKEKPLLLLAMVNDKDWKSSAGILAQGSLWEEIMVTQISGERALDAKELSGADAFGGCRISVCKEAAKAYNIMKERRRGGQKLFCAGSLYFIGELLETLNEPVMPAQRRTL